GAGICPSPTSWESAATRSGEVSTVIGTRDPGYLPCDGDACTWEHRRMIDRPPRMDVGFDVSAQFARKRAQFWMHAELGHRRLFGGNHRGFGRHRGRLRGRPAAERKKQRG